MKKLLQLTVGFSYLAALMLNPALTIGGTIAICLALWVIID